MSFETITPDKARGLLALNTHNRRLHKSHVAELARAMAEGRWLDNPSPIIIGADGVLLDGQHRLTACVRANVAFRSIVLRGAAVALREVLDTGKPRSGLDVCKLMGMEISNDDIGAFRYAAAFVVSQETGTWPSRDRVRMDRQQTAKAMSECLDAIRPLVNRCRKKAGRRVVTPPALAAGFWHMLRTHDARRDDQEEFFDGFVSGAELALGAPALTLRNAWLDAANLHGRAQRTIAWRAAVMVYAWNAHVERRTIRSLRWRIGTPFPSISLRR